MFLLINNFMPKNWIDWLYPVLKIMKRISYEGTFWLNLGEVVDHELMLYCSWRRWEMEKEQQLEWLEAQKIVISEDLVAVAKMQLQFLAVVDKHRCLYDGPTLQKAIYR